MTRASLLGLLLLAAPALAGAVEIDAIQGAYHHAFANGDVQGDKFQGEDVLEVVKLSADTAYIRLHLDFFNGHMCSLWGVADLEGDTLVYRSKTIPGCELTLSFGADAVTFADRDGVCRQQNCGMRGGFNGARFETKNRRAIHYMDKLMASRQYKEALAERDAR
jgi:hypothetical protein